MTNTTTTTKKKKSSFIRVYLCMYISCKRRHFFSYHCKAGGNRVRQDPRWFCQHKTNTTSQYVLRKYHHLVSQRIERKKQKKERLLLVLFFICFCFFLKQMALICSFPFVFLRSKCICFLRKTGMFQHGVRQERSQDFIIEGALIKYYNILIFE